MTLNERERYSHPSYGMIRVSRVNGNPGKFFGSELEVDNYIELTVNTGEMDRDLSRDWYSSSHRHPLIQVRMTPLQFSELITSLNMGDGIPCTLEWVDGKKIEQEKTYESKKEATHRQFKERMRSFADTLRKKQLQAIELVKKKTLSKDDQHSLTMTLNWLTSEIESNIPFFMECFQEVADKVVAEAKAEVEGAILHKVTTLGLNALHEQNKLLGDGK